MSDALTRLRQSHAFHKVARVLAKHHQDACDGYAAAPERWREERQAWADLLTVLGRGGDEP